MGAGLFMATMAALEIAGNLFPKAIAADVVDGIQIAMAVIIFGLAILGGRALEQRFNRRRSAQVSFQIAGNAA